jgi:predicted ATP-grasp superfamily ATP-dependent carboligase
MTEATKRCAVLIVNRWDDDNGRYERYLSHAENAVYYVTTQKGLDPIAKDLAKGIEVVNSLSDEAEVLEKVGRLARLAGGFDKVLALSEYDIALGARIRAHFGITGTTPDEARLYVDKVAMKEAVKKAGLRVPRFAQTETAGKVLEFAREVGFPVVIKPRVGAGSRGVYKSDSEEQLRARLQNLALENYECEEYVEGSILHVDGVTANSGIVFLQASRYFNTCLDFMAGIPLGSVFIQDRALNERIERFTAEVLRGIGLRVGAFHLELFLTGSGEFLFLEIGARVGGGEINFVIQDVLGIDIFSLWLGLEMGQELPAVIPDRGAVGGFLLIPEPRDIPCRVDSVTSLLGRVDCLYCEILPQVGQILDGSGGYETISGRFRFKGDSEEQVVAAIKKVVHLFDMKYSPIDGCNADGHPK